jgi:hypothetical protein
VSDSDAIEELMGDRVGEHEHRFSATDWPFSDPTNAVAISTRQVVREGYPVLRVSHDFDGDWQVLCGTTTDVEDALVVCLGCAFQRNPCIGALADLPRGWTAWRDSPDDPWTREPKVPEPDDE